MRRVRAALFLAVIAALLYFGRTELVRWKACDDYYIVRPSFYIPFTDQCWYEQNPGEWRLLRMYWIFGGNDRD